MSDLATKQKFDWSKLIDLPSMDACTPGRQVLGFHSYDRDYQEHPDARDFVEQYLSNAKEFEIDAEVMKYGCDQMTLDGLILEMGVCTGRTINFIAALNPQKNIYGFDSFAGLPEPLECGKEITYPQGIFAYKDPTQLPPVLHNVKLMVGLFEDTLPSFKEKILGTKPISFLHVDCDNYSSTKTLFSELGDNIVEGTIIEFDELYNYPGCLEHEFKAFQEFLASQNKVAEYLAFNSKGKQVAVRIHNGN